MDVDFHPTGNRIEIPAAFADRLESVYDRRPSTVWEWWMLEGKRAGTAVDELTAGDFYTERPTRHDVTIDGDEDGGYTPCVLDAMAAAAMEEDTATVHSTDPVTDTVVTIEFDDSSVHVTPETAVISIGRKLQPETEVASHDSIIELSRAVDEDEFIQDFCKYGNAFESEASFARWSAEADAVAFAAGGEQISTLLHRLHRTHRGLLVAGIVRTFAMDLVRATTGKLVGSPDNGENGSYRAR